MTFAKKTLIAMSGGVDSSVAAALLKNQGHNVIGVFIFFQPKKIMQTSYQSARKVADKLGITLRTLDFIPEFQNMIINKFVSEYKKGNTPNPCIWCNKFLKFGKLFDFAKKLGCSHIATGHYARTLKHLNTKALKHNFKLITAKDKNKDQSYFLYELTQNKLKHILFPLGNLKKDKVKKLAKKFGLPVYQKKESSDVCFINADIRGFLKARINADKGDIVNTDSKVIGQHIGLPFYTLGQRQGINIGGTGPYYVIKKDFKNNKLLVTNNPQDPQLFSDKIIIKNINWISGQEPILPLKCLAQHRYQTEMSEVYVNVYVNDYVIHPVKSPTQARGVPTLSGQFNRVKFKKPQRAVTPGQSLVFYKPLRRFFNRDYEILGGGVIEQ